MQQIPSRREKRESKMVYASEQGKFEIDAHLYKNEEKSLKKDGFTVNRFGQNEKKSLPSKISWENAFHQGPPLLVSCYIDGHISTFPKVQNWAQELYVIAARANKVKAQKNKE